jgi:hypothetical protein
LLRLQECRKIFTLNILLHYVKLFWFHYQVVYTDYIGMGELGRGTQCRPIYWYMLGGHNFYDGWTL